MSRASSALWRSTGVELEEELVDAVFRKLRLPWFIPVMPPSAVCS